MKNNKYIKYIGLFVILAICIMLNLIKPVRFLIGFIIGFILLYDYYK